MEPIFGRLMRKFDTTSRRSCLVLTGTGIPALAALYMGENRAEAREALDELNARRRALGLPEIRV